MVAGVMAAARVEAAEAAVRGAVAARAAVVAVAVGSAVDAAGMADTPVTWPRPMTVRGSARARAALG
jgi:hypothetical protein